jgi:hypothetical protein
MNGLCKTPIKNYFIFRGKFGGLSIALCCHHRCLWKPYVGKSFFLKNGLSARDFQILCKLSSWTAATWSGWKSVQEMNTALGVPQTRIADGQQEQISLDHGKSENRDEKDDSLIFNDTDANSDEMGHSRSEIDINSEDSEDEHVERNSSKR